MSNVRTIAREIIREACEKHDGDMEPVLNARFPATHGGVAHAHRKMRAEVMAEIKRFYAAQSTAHISFHRAGGYC